MRTYENKLVYGNCIILKATFKFSSVILIVYAIFEHNKLVKTNKSYLTEIFSQKVMFYKVVRRDLRNNLERE
jgi:hypothetical protein